ncbi:MAG TPA: riboflavin synthase [Candidatus Nanoarchaeia archaeon]|nr:riboflavin synthase [Candidatus Nanoarchaeia archaeon]
MRIGLADTTFSRIDMAAAALNAIKKEYPTIATERYTVPGFKDLPVACKILIEHFKCDIVLAFGWVGKEDLDEFCAHEANLGLIQCELMTNTHILKIFFHEKETSDKEQQKTIALDRAEKHALNALALLKGKETLTESTGKGRRQGYPHAGEIV